MEFDRVLADLITAVNSSSSSLVSRSLVVLCLLAADTSAEYPLASADEAKRIVSLSLQLVKEASPSLRLVAAVEPVLHSGKKKQKKLSLRPSRDPVACYAGIQRQVEDAIAHKLDASTMEMLFPRSSLTTFYTALSEDERRAALDELVGVAAGWVQAFDTTGSDYAPDYAQLLADVDKVQEFVEKRESDILSQTALHYLQQLRTVVGRATTLDAEIAKLSDLAKERRHGKRAEVFSLLAELGSLRRERSEMGNLEFCCSVLTLIEQAVTTKESAHADDVIGNLRPESIVLENKWSSVSYGEKGRAAFLNAGRDQLRLPVECGVETEVLVKTSDESGSKQTSTDEWEKLKRMLHAVNLQHKVTKSTQTDASTFREAKSTQVYKTSEAGTATMQEKGTQPVRMKRYVAGLRGEDKEQFRDVHWRIQ